MRIMGILGRLRIVGIVRIMRRIMRGIMSRIMGRIRRIDRSVNARRLSK